MDQERNKLLLQYISEAHDQASKDLAPKVLLEHLLSYFLALTNSSSGLMLECTLDSFNQVQVSTLVGSINLSKEERQTILQDFHSDLRTEKSYPHESVITQYKLNIPILYQSALIGVVILQGSQQGYSKKLKEFLNPIIKTSAHLLDRFKSAREHASAEQELRRSESFLNSIIKNIPNMVFVKEASELRFVLFNRAGEDLVGLKSSDLIGRNDFDFFPKEQAEFFVKKDREVLNNGKLVEIPHEEIQTKNGIRILHTRKIPILNKEGMPLYLLGISEDITDQEALLHTLDQARNQAQSASRAKSEFLANMSHEIRTPMNGILGMVDLLSDISAQPIHQEYLGAIKTSAEALLLVINDILDFSKIEAGITEIVAEDFSLSRMVKDLKLMFGVKAATKGILFQVEVDSKLPKMINADPIRIRQALTNLLGNALKFTDCGGEVTFSLSQDKIADGGSNVLFEIKDNGIGVAPEKLSTIFDAFAQADASISRRYGGTGLGLAISAKLVRLMGGEIKAESQPGHGSRFWFSIPFKPANADFAGQILDMSDSNPRISIKGHGRILLTEDNEINQKVVTHILEHHGYTVVVASTGEEAIEKVKQTKFDLILMDVQLPVMDGLTATTHIRSMTESLSRIPILALTAHAYGGYKEECLKAGMNDFLSKPINRYELLEKISILLTKN